MENSSNTTRTVTRTYRAAIRLGEDYITLEEAITLPIEATDDEVQQAVNLGWRMYQSQRESIEQQLAAVREAHGGPTPIIVRDPDAPASDKQRNYIATLQDQLTWSNEQLAVHAAEQAVDLVTLTKGQASVFIDDLKKLADERMRYVADSRTRMVAESTSDSAAEAGQPASERQLNALMKLATSRALNFDEEVKQRFGIAGVELNNEQARTLLNEWQARPTAKK